MPAKQRTRPATDSEEKPGFSLALTHRRRSATVIRAVAIVLTISQLCVRTSTAIPSLNLKTGSCLPLRPGSLERLSSSKQEVQRKQPSLQRETGILRMRGGGWFDNQFNLSDKELKALAGLRQQLGTVLTDAAKQNPDLDTDDRLIRLLRVHDLNVAKTVPLFKKMLGWRAEVKADKIRDEIVKHFSDRFWDMPCIPHKQKFRRFYFYEPFHALDRTGELLSIECTGAIRVRRFMRAVSERDVMIFWTYIMEWNMYKLAQLSRKQGRLVSMAQVKDLAGLNFVQASSKAGMSRFRKVNRFMHESYPECLSSLSLINVPPIFGALWRAFRPLLPPRTISKIAVVAGGEQTQRQHLRRLLPSTDPVVKNAGAADLYVPKGGVRQNEGGGGRLLRVLKLGMATLGLLFLREVTGVLGGGAKVVRTHAEQQQSQRKTSSN